MVIHHGCGLTRPAMEDHREEPTHRGVERTRPITGFVIKLDNNRRKGRRHRFVRKRLDSPQAGYIWFPSSSTERAAPELLSSRCSADSRIATQSYPLNGPHSLGYGHLLPCLALLSPSHLQWRPACPRQLDWLNRLIQSPIHQVRVGLPAGVFLPDFDGVLVLVDVL